MPPKMTVARLSHCCGNSPTYLVAHAENTINVLHEVQRGQNLHLDLILPAEHVRVILTESPHSREPGQCSAQLRPDDVAKSRFFSQMGQHGNTSQ